MNFSNTPRGASKVNFTVRYVINIFRSWFIFRLRFPWVKYNGFVRVMAYTRFAKRDIVIGNRVQFGRYCSIATDVHFEDNILIASRVCFVGKNDHTIDIPGQYIWDGERGNDALTRVESDVWIGHNSTIIAGVKIGKGSIVAAGSIVNKDVPECEIWGGVPAKKIKDRFFNDLDKEKHLKFLNKQDFI